MLFRSTVVVALTVGSALRATAVVGAPLFVVSGRTSYFFDVDFFFPGNAAAFFAVGVGCGAGSSGLLSASAPFFFGFLFRPCCLVDCGEVDFAYDVERRSGGCAFEGEYLGLLWSLCAVGRCFGFFRFLSRSFGFWGALFGRLDFGFGLGFFYFRFGL